MKKKQRIKPAVDLQTIKEKMLMMMYARGRSEHDFYLMTPELRLRFVAACEVYQRVLIPLQWDRVGIRKSVNDITRWFEPSHWLALAESSNNARIRAYAFEMVLIQHLEFLKDDEQGVFHHYANFTQLLAVMDRHQELMKQFPDELVIIVQAFANKAQELNALIPEISIWLLVVDRCFQSARRMAFVSLTKDLLRERDRILKQLPRLAKIDYDYFLQEQNHSAHYFKEIVFKKTPLFKLLFTWPVWSNHTATALQILPILMDLLSPQAIAPLFEIAIQSSQCRDRQKVDWGTIDMCEPLRDMITGLDQGGYGARTVIMRRDFERFVKYLITKCENKES